MTASLSGFRGLSVRWSGVWAVALLATACGGGAAAGGAGGGGGGRGGMPPMPVSIVTVAPHVVPTPFEFPAQVEPYRRVEVRARVDGVILSRPFTEGSVVHAGQLLYQLDTVKYAAAWQSARAVYENAKSTLARLEPLLPRHAVAQQDVDNARTAVESARAALDQATKDLSDTRVRAEMSGRVGRTRLDVGARVTGPADLLTTIDRVDPVYVTFRPSSEVVSAWHQRPSDRRLLQPGAGLRVRVVFSDSSVLPTIGQLDFVAPSLDSATGTQEFRAKFANANGALVPGAFVRVRLDGFKRAQALTVPQRAVLQGLGSQFVYVVGRGDTVSARDVKPGPWTGHEWVIDSGLVAGDRVVVDGTQKIGPGAVVQPVPAGDSTGTPQPGGARGAGRGSRP